MQRPAPTTTILEIFTADNPASDQIIAWLDEHRAEIEEPENFENVCRLATTIVYKIVPAQAAHDIVSKMKQGNRQGNAQVNLAKNILSRYLAPLISNFHMIEIMLANFGLVILEFNSDYQEIFDYLNFMVIRERADVMTSMDELFMIKSIFLYNSDAIVVAEVEEFSAAIKFSSIMQDEAAALEDIKSMQPDFALSYLMKFYKNIKPDLFERLFLSALKEKIFSKLITHPDYDYDKLTPRIMNYIANFQAPSAIPNEKVQKPFADFVAKLVMDNQESILNKLENVLELPIELFLKRNMDTEFYLLCEIAESKLGTSIVNIIKMYMAELRALIHKTAAMNADRSLTIMAEHVDVLKTFTNTDAIQAFLKSMHTADEAYNSACATVSQVPSWQNLLTLHATKPFHDTLRKNKKLRDVLAVLPKEARDELRHLHAPCVPVVNHVGVFRKPQRSGSMQTLKPCPDTPALRHK